MAIRGLVIGVGVAVVTAAFGASDSVAGSYHVYSCRTPAGEAAPVDGWVGSKVGTYTYAEDTCAHGGALVAGLGDQAARTANTDSATWAFTAPAASRMTQATLWRAGDAAGGAAVSAFYEFWFAAPEDRNEPADAFSQCVAGSCPAGFGNPSEPLSPENRLPVPTPNLGHAIYMHASCVGESGFKCKTGQGDANNFAAVVYLYAADLVLEQTAGPTAGSVAGELASASSVAGTSDVTFSASDPGAGVYEAQIAIDGTPVQTTVLNENGGRCRNVGQTTDGLPAFLYVQPCLASLSADVALDTTRFPNGTHHLVVSVIDAAGNSAPVLDRQVVFANPSATERPGQTGAGQGTGTPAGVSAGVLGPPGAPNGQNASAPASLAVHWVGARGPRLVSDFGRVHRAEGRLATLGGAPIAGALIEVIATPAAAGAASLGLSAVRTRANGTFSLSLPANASSRTLRFYYRARFGDRAPAAAASLALTVRAALRLSITPRVASVGHRIYFSGRLLGGPVPASGKLVVLEARAGGGGWIKFDVVRASRTGRLHASYRFRFPGPVVYQFRAVSEAESDYAFASGASNVVRVFEH